MRQANLLPCSHLTRSPVRQAACFLYHRSHGAWAPDVADAKSCGDFTSIVVQAYIFCKIPPIEAARWAWVFAMTPWIADQLNQPTGEGVKEATDT